ncbi:6-hydroxy-D-nicotine oxidase [Madurella mycetomatis]|uniref:6-hydroxy-D-nicotine oxidase n=1 Tax=Madurella mycetomatis TaxID=100816 RepID=A0A175W7Y2_9PEZI|nr:6-hydroxy-D-nicotine oxidase [Madurella mycetomatis]KXX79662.1 6-hydroxy-D-nicotine oxidase [Madurella mycetomatis]
MSILSLQRTLLLAGAVLPLAPLGLAQTIVGDDGNVLPANEITVAPAAEPDTLQLTDAVIANLTAHQLSDIELFRFDNEAGDTSVSAKRGIDFGRCKTFPGDLLWPSSLTWAVFNLLTGGALIETVPIGAVCYPSSGVYDAAKCADVIANWAQSETHANDPTSVMSPLYTGETCMPQNGNTSTCTLGGFPSYAVKATSVFQIQLAVNLARNLNLRLVVKNTGHDFLGKSCGAGALSIWTHNLKTIKHIKSFRSPSYSGPALKLGAGVQVGELYAAADSFGVTAVGGECKGVGVAGGYTAGGGHSPLSGKFGLGSDQVLSIDVVLPNGRFVTASETENTDLFWAMRGGGGATFGVVTSMTVKVYPKMSFAGLTWTIVSGPDTPNPDSLFWDAMYAYWRKFPEYASKGAYGYSMIFPRGAPGSGYVWTMQPFHVPGMPLAEFQAMVAPLFEEWTALGFDFAPTYFEHDNFYDTWSQHFPTEAVANSNLRTASRLFPASNWEDEATREAMFDAVRSVVEEGSALIQYNMRPAAPAGTPASGANSHWRDAVWFGIMGTGWAPGLSESELEAVHNKITHNWMERLRVYGPGAYGNEGDVMEPDFGEAFFGTNYGRLLQIKRRVDPSDVFWAPTAVGSETWEVADQADWLTTQTGRLCKVSA